VDLLSAKTTLARNPRTLSEALRSREVVFCAGVNGSASDRVV
jgi:hypothetical protein